MNPKCYKKIVSISTHGQIIKCSTCNKFHIEFKNLQFDLNPLEFSFFKKCFLNLDAAYWEYKNERSQSFRKILIDLNHENISARFNKEEIMKLQELLSGSKTNEEFLKVDHFDVSFCSN